MNFEHKSVLLQETVNAVVTDSDGIYVDCTLGGGGHAFAVTQRLSEKAWFIGIDQDPAAVRAGKARLANAKCRVDILHGNFHELGALLDEIGVPAINGIIFDLGVSSYQLDTAERGFSYMQSGPLDMRMNPDDGLSAAQVVNGYAEQRLAAVISDYGEERWARRIARSIVRARADKPLETTAELVAVIKSAIPAAARREGPHPAKRTFQAIRIEVNNELGILKEAFSAAVGRLKTGGRIGIITFHSLEDRLAKQTLQDLAKGCVCPRDFPVCVCQNKPKVKILGKPVLPSANEIEDNPRSRSARLRVAEKV